MPEFKFRLTDVADRTQLAINLGVPVRAIDLVELAEIVCKSNDCNLLAAARNQG